MTFETILNTVSEQADIIGLPLVFGDTNVQNVAANNLGVDFFTLDIAGGTVGVTTYASDPQYTVVIRCMGTSHYLRNDAEEIATLIRTDLGIRSMLQAVVCKLEVTTMRITKLQNEYDSIKSGWQVTFDVIDSALID
ncbi:hypothetical protein BV57P2_00005 [Phocaeicola phage BV57P2]|jgi:hypothetical protein|nr:hypothetical protein BV57P1_00026 [Phocaeicola phage BV57P1]WAX10313.1 hypothetical protein BV57P2_00005 [Phocaeicola phage BV57P2]WAX10629.1 hypothetical protein BV283P3_00021 [Phocaeicola phage BV283P3]WAX10660.1 hypothetical protein BV674P5_00003 [Phocaeicola phage BV674P5]WAX10725.1 hypothetical protein BV737P2_00022 [Phocaeicola phage BV737P2]WAX10950.1 hypothetical protein BV741P4_00003 [Phocaeicola phage BV741P4]